MNGYFLFHGMLVQLTCSILEPSLCPHCWRGKVFGVQWKVKMMSFGPFGSEIFFVFSLSALTLKNKEGVGFISVLSFDCLLLMTVKAHSMF